jgi:hypothetical protein
MIVTMEEKMEIGKCKGCNYSNKNGRKEPYCSLVHSLLEDLEGFCPKEVDVKTLRQSCESFMAADEVRDSNGEDLCAAHLADGHVGSCRIKKWRDLLGDPDYAKKNDDKAAVERLLKKIRKEATERFGPEFMEWKENYAPLGSVEINPQKQGDVIITINFILKMMKNWVTSRKKIALRVENNKKRLDELQTEIKDTIAENAFLKDADSFISQLTK